MVPVQPTVVSTAYPSAQVTYAAPRLSYPNAAPMPAVSYAAAPAATTYVAAPPAQHVTHHNNRRRRVVGRVGMMPRERSLSMYPSTTHVLIIALDYKGTANELSCTVDGNNMQALARAAGIQDVVVLYDHQATKARVEQAIASIGARCGPEDTVLVNYSGHGTSVTDYDGDEVDGQDEAYVLVDESGQAIPPTENSLMTDDELSDCLISKLPAGINLVVISDCCHSGSIVDLGKPAWRGRKAVSISGCRDTQTSGDTGHGGICTHSLLMAIEALQKKGKSSYTVGELFRQTVKIDDEVFNSPQDITIHCSHGVSQHGITWPLVPKTSYTAPYRNHAPFGGASVIEPQPQPTVTHHYTSAGGASCMGGSYMLTPSMTTNITEAFGMGSAPHTARPNTYWSSGSTTQFLKPQGAYTSQAQVSMPASAPLIQYNQSGFGTPAAPSPPMFQYNTAGSTTPPVFVTYN